MGEALIPVVLALGGSATTVVAAVLARRSGAEDRTARRQEAEVRYLAERLDKERDRADALEEEVRRCHARLSPPGARPAPPPAPARTDR
jgi:hypothetical protein